MPYSIPKKIKRIEPLSMVLLVACGANQPIDLSSLDGVPADLFANNVAVTVSAAEPDFVVYLTLRDNKPLPNNLPDLTVYLVNNNNNRIEHSGQPDVEVVTNRQYNLKFSFTYRGSNTQSEAYNFVIAAGQLLDGAGNPTEIKNPLLVVTVTADMVAPRIAIKGSSEILLGQNKEFTVKFLVTDDERLSTSANFANNGISLQAANLPPLTSTKIIVLERKPNSIELEATFTYTGGETSRIEYTILPTSLRVIKDKAGNPLLPADTAKIGLTSDDTRPTMAFFHANPVKKVSISRPEFSLDIRLSDTIGFDPDLELVASIFQLVHTGGTILSGYNLESLAKTDTTVDVRIYFRMTATNPDGSYRLRLNPDYQAPVDRAGQSLQVASSAQAVQLSIDKSAPTATVDETNILVRAGAILTLTVTVSDDDQLAEDPMYAWDFIFKPAAGGEALKPLNLNREKPTTSRHLYEVEFKMGSFGMSQVSYLLQFKDRLPKDLAGNPVENPVKDPVANPVGDNLISPINLTVDARGPSSQIDPTTDEFFVQPGTPITIRLTLQDDHRLATDQLSSADFSLRKGRDIIGENPAITRNVISDREHHYTLVFDLSDTPADVNTYDLYVANLPADFVGNLMRQHSLGKIRIALDNGGPTGRVIQTEMPLYVQGGEVFTITIAISDPSGVATHTLPANNFKLRTAANQVEATSSQVTAIAGRANFYAVEFTSPTSSVSTVTYTVTSDYRFQDQVGNTMATGTVGTLSILVDTSAPTASIVANTAAHFISPGKRFFVRVRIEDAERLSTAVLADNAFKLEQGGNLFLTSEAVSRVATTQTVHVYSVRFQAPTTTSASADYALHFAQTPPTDYAGNQVADPQIGLVRLGVDTAPPTASVGTLAFTVRPSNRFSVMVTITDNTAVSTRNLGDQDFRLMSGQTVFLTSVSVTTTTTTLDRNVYNVVFEAPAAAAARANYELEFVNLPSDRAGNAMTQRAIGTINLAIDNTAPVVNPTSKTYYARPSTPLSVIITLSDTNGVDQAVQYQNTGFRLEDSQDQVFATSSAVTQVNIGNTIQFTIQFNLPGTDSVGTYRLFTTESLVDNAGNPLTGSLADVVVHVDGQAPELTLEDGTHSVRVGRAFTVTVSISDDTGLSSSYSYDAGGYQLQSANHTLTSSDVRLQAGATTTEHVITIQFSAPTNAQAQADYILATVAGEAFGADLAGNLATVAANSGKVQLTVTAAAAQQIDWQSILAAYASGGATEATTAFTPEWYFD